MTQNHKESSLIADFVISGVSAGISKTIAAPIQLTVVVAQRINAAAKQSPGITMPSLFQTMSQSVEQRGLSSLWRGNFRVSLNYSYMQAINFAFKDYFKKIFNVNRDKDGSAKWVAANIVAGSAAGAISTLILCLQSHIKTKLANDQFKKMAGKPEFNGFFDVIIKTIKTKGIGELYRGWVGLCFGTVIYRGIYFGMYDSIKPSLPSRVRNNLGANFLLGWFISVAASFATEPIDAVRRRMFIPPVKYKSYVECIRETVKKEGVASLFARFETNLHKRLAAGLTLALYDRLKLQIYGEKQ